VENFVAPGAANRPPLRVVWCARALREYENLYNITVMAVTQDRSDEALISKLSMSGVGYDNALSISKQFIGAIEIAKNSVSAAAASAEVKK